MRAENCIVRSVQTLNLLIAKPDIPADQRAAFNRGFCPVGRKGVAINPRTTGKLTALAADRFAATGNLEAALWTQDSVAASRPYIPHVHANRVPPDSSLQNSSRRKLRWKFFKLYNPMRRVPVH